MVNRATATDRPSPDDPARVSSRSLATAIAVATGLILTVVAARNTDRVERAHVESEFRTIAADQSSAIRRELSEQMQVLHAIGGLFDASSFVDRDEFHAFTAPMLERHPGIQALEWIPRVPVDERATYEASARRDGFAGFEITERAPDGGLVPASSRAVHYPVFYLEPYRGNEAAAGFDLSSNPTRLAALERARDTGQPVASAPITLVQEAGHETSVLVFVPRYRKDAPTLTVEDRRGSLSGFVLGVYRTCDIIKAALAGVRPTGIETMVYDVSADDERTLIAHHGPGVPDPITGSAAGTPRLSELTRSTMVSLAGRTWLIRSVPAEPFLAAQRSNAAGWILVVGLLFTALVTSYVVLLTGRTARIERTVRERTAAITAQTLTLEREVADRKRVEQQLTSSNESLAVRNQEMLQLAYAMTHDLQTPLATVTGAVAALQEEVSATDAGAARWVERIQSASNRMVAMLDDLMVYARAGTQDVKNDLVDVREQVEAALDSHHDVAARLGVELRIAGGTGTVMGDAGILMRVVSNLVSNAIKHRGDDTGGTVEVTIDSDESVVRVFVRDDGIGLPSWQLEEVFLPFKRASTSASGTGLGLAIVRKHVEGYGGRVWLESDGHSGTTAILEMPAAPASVRVVEATAA